MTHSTSAPLRSRPRTTRAASVWASVWAVATAAAVGALSLGPLSGLAQAATTCVPTAEAPTLEVEPGPVAIGGTVKVSGEGWCHPTEGGSAVALKIDEGAISRLDTAVHRNQTIWTIVQADEQDGTFSVDVPLPDGTTATSEPAFAVGTHTLRALTGSIKPGDVVRSVLSSEFVVGEHRPQGIPDAVGPDQLIPGSTGGLEATLDGRRLSLRLPNAQRDDWVFVSLLAADGSPRYPWGATWHRLGADGRLALGPGQAPVEGPHRVVVQDGNLGATGDLLGWAQVAYPVSKPAPAPQKPNPAPSPSTPTPKPGTPATPPSAPAPSTGAAPSVALPVAAPVAAGVPVAAQGVMASPVRSWGALRPAQRLDSSLDEWDLVVRTGRERDELFVHVYDATSSAPAGWTATDGAGRARLDLASLPNGDYRFTLVDGDEKLVGWAEATVGADAEAATTAGGVSAAPVVAAAAAERSWVGSTDAWLAGVGAALLAGALIGRGRKETLR